MGAIERYDIHEEWAHAGIIRAGDFCFLNYCARHQKCNEEIHSVHPPSVARLGKVQGSTYRITKFASFRNIFFHIGKIRKILVGKNFQYLLHRKLLCGIL